MRPFTLLELLVVIAVIALLAAILLPALKVAKDTGQRIYCTGNLKTMALGFNMYQDESPFIPSRYCREMTADKNVNPENKNDNMQVSFWIYRTIYGTGDPFYGKFSDRQRSVIAKNHGKMKTFLCPATTYGTDTRQLLFDSPIRSWSWNNLSDISYGYNYYLFIQPPGLAPQRGDYSCFRYSRLANPTSLSIFVEGKGSFFLGGTGISIRHGNKIPAAFADGHAASFLKTDYMCSYRVSTMSQCPNHGLYCTRMWNISDDVKRKLAPFYGTDGNSRDDFIQNPYKK